MSQTRASEPFTVRPATLDDARDIVNLRNACAVERMGKPATNLQAVQGTMQMPGLDLEGDTLLAHGPEGQLAGLALVQVNPPSPLIYALFEVHPRYWRTDVGEFENSESRYGTFDQGGNAWEWNEAVTTESTRCVRGGSFDFYHVDTLHAAFRLNLPPMSEANGTDGLGFRVAEIPEPATFALLAFGGTVMMRRRR